MPGIGTIFRVGEVLKKSMQANAVFRQSNQEHVNRIVRSVYKAIMDNRISLSKMAIEETGLGNYKDKVLKTVVAAQFVYEYIKDRKTVGVISDDLDKGITEIVHPIGTVLGVVSDTDPIASAVFKILISLKTRNAIILSPNEKAVKITEKICKLCYDAALAEDAPEDCIQSFFDTDSDEFNNIIYDKRLALIIGAGDDTFNDRTAGLGAPVIGTGNGNVPVYVTKTIDVKFAATQIIASKNFDNGVMNSSEQAVVVDLDVAGRFKKALIEKGAYFVNDSKEKNLLSDVIFDEENRVNNNIIGQSPYNIAKYAGFSVPENTKILVIPLYGVGKNFPLSGRILAPIISYYEANTFDDAVNLCIDLNYRTKPEPEYTSIVGSSFGGVASFYTGYSHAQIFGNIGAFSPSFWLGTRLKNITFMETEFMREVLEYLDHCVQVPKLWIDWSICETPIAKRIPRLINYLTEAYNYELDKNIFYFEDIIGQHDERAWEYRFRLFIEKIYGNNK